MKIDELTKIVNTLMIAKKESLVATVNDFYYSICRGSDHLAIHCTNNLENFEIACWSNDC